MVNKQELDRMKPKSKLTTAIAERKLSYASGYTAPAVSVNYRRRKARDTWKAGGGDTSWYI